MKILFSDICSDKCALGKQECSNILRPLDTVSKLPLIPGYLKCHHGVTFSMGTYKDQEINGILN